jgi:FkbM family methyltransferase
MLPVPRSIARIPILRGLYRIALNGYARLSRGRYMVEERMGLRLLLDLDNVVDQQVFVSGTWEKGPIDTLLGLAQKERQRHDGEAVFVDIGAHWGLYALVAHQSRMFDRIVAFEPDPTNFGQLQANLFLNGATTAIEALQLATSDRERTFGLSLATSRNRGGTRVVDVAQADQVTCRAIRVDQQLDFAGKLLVIKMDVEGHEMEAVEGLLGLLAKNHCVLQIEIWSTPEEEMPRRLALLETLFAHHGIKFVSAIITDHYFVSQPRAQRSQT